MMNRDMAYCKQFNYPETQVRANLLPPSTFHLCHSTEEMDSLVWLG